MRITTAILLAVIASGTLIGQDRNPYGPVGVLAYSSNQNGLTIATQLANATVSVLRTEGNVAIRDGALIPVVEPELSDQTLVTLSGKLGVSWLAIVEFDAKDRQHGIFQVDVAHVVAGKVASRVSALFGALSVAVQQAGQDIAAQASRAAHAITTYVSQHKVVRVILSLLTRPGDADYTFGTADVRHTDHDGRDVWDTTQPVGTTTLHIFKQGYNDQSFEITIPSIADESYVPITRVADLKRHP
jgi:hypothetical protein